MDVGSVVVEPDVFGPGFFSGRFVVEEKDVGFNTVGVEDAGGEAENGVYKG